MTKVKKLTKEEIRTIYDGRMCSDFPKEELKPFVKISELYDKDRYAGYSVVDEKGEILSYALFARIPASHSSSHYLFDYFAVREDLRNAGIGTFFLRQLTSCLKDAESVIGEVENPEFAKDAAEEALRSRRLRFYERNNVRMCGVTASVFGVEFHIVEAVLKKAHSKDCVREILRTFYSLFFSEQVLKEQVVIR